jgi:glutamate carboxypeptidase
MVRNKHFSERRLGRRVVLVAAAACLLGVRPVVGQSALSADERELAKYVDEHNDEALALLKRAVNVNSGTENFAGVRNVGEIFRREFDLLGFKTQWVDGASWERAGHLVADHPGAGPRLLLIGHLDTVFAPDSPFQNFEQVDVRTARGPGIIDMKGGDVIIIQALKALAAAGVLKTMNVRVVMTGDEEAPGRPLTLARAALREAATGAVAAIGFEDGDGDPAHAVIARRGFTSWTLTVTGKGGHSGQVCTPDIGCGAVYEAARIVTAFREHLSTEPHLTFNIGVFLGGTKVDFDAAASKGTAFGKTNVVAAETTVTGDLRALTPEQFSRVIATMKAIVGRSLPHTVASISFDESYPPLAPTDGNSKLLSLYDGASRDLGLGAVEAVSPDKAGAADVSFVAGIVPMIIDAAGLKGHDDHSSEETADLTTLPVQTKRAAVLLARLARSDGRP